MGTLGVGALDEDTARVIGSTCLQNQELELSRGAYLNVDALEEGLDVCFGAASTVAELDEGGILELVDHLKLLSLGEFC